MESAETLEHTIVCTAEPYDPFGLGGLQGLLAVAVLILGAKGLWDAWRNRRTGVALLSGRCLLWSSGVAFLVGALRGAVLALEGLSIIEKIRHPDRSHLATMGREALAAVVIGTATALIALFLFGICAGLVRRPVTAPEADGAPRAPA